MALLFSRRDFNGHHLARKIITWGGSTTGAAVGQRDCQGDRAGWGGIGRMDSERKGLWSANLYYHPKIDFLKKNLGTLLLEKDFLLSQMVNACHHVSP